MNKNVIIDTDAYKIPHWAGYHPQLNKGYSYGESRLGSKYDKVCFAGLTPIVTDHFLQPVTNHHIEETRDMSFDTFGTDKYFDIETWKKVRDLGYLPIKLMAVPEGTVVDVDNVLFTLESTKDWFAKTYNALEGTLMHTWYPTTVSTRTLNIKKNITPAFEKSCDDWQIYIEYAVNDFGYRGATCHEAAARGGAAFAMHFAGSDNLPAGRLIKDYYGYKGRIKSVWATEHSVAMSFGITFENELEYLKHQLIHAEPHLIISVVIDTKDSDEFIRAVVGDPEIMEMIKQRTGRVVFRPDSGKALRNICTYSDMLGSMFGFTMNRKGYKIINHNVGLIQGDGMDEESIPELYNEYIKTGWSAQNAVTGSGGGLLQVDLNRDIQRFAIKPSYGEKNGIPFYMKKTPKTDMSKGSKAGLLKLTQAGLTLSSADFGPAGVPSMFDSYKDMLQPVLVDGVFTPQKFEDMLKRLKK